MIWKTILVVVLSLFPSWGYAEGFPATKYPFAPKLTENQEPALCEIFLNHATKVFKSSDPNPVLSEIKSPSISWVKWAQIDITRSLDPTEKIYGGPEYLRADLDLDGNGQIKTVVQHIFWHSWRGKNYESYVFRSSQAFANALKQTKAVSADTETQTLFSKAIQYYPTDPTGSVGFSDWNSHNLFQYKKRFYFPSSGTESDLGGGFSIVHLGGDGSLRVVCSIQMVPDERELRKFVSLPGLSSYLKVVRAMGHAGGGGDCGTLNAEGNHDGGAEAAVMRAGFRPWAIGRYLGNNREDPYYRYDPRLESFVRGWSYEDVWNYREYQTSRAHIEPAIQVLAQYLEQNFGVRQPRVAMEARKVFEELTAAWFLVPSRWVSRDISLGDDSIQTTIVKGDVEAVKSFEEHLTAEEINKKGYLLASVESLPITKILLKVGADPNAQNRFGKTALMYAAHMNRPDVMEELLKYKADMKAVTQPINECDTKIERSGRTALMYAAENAHPSSMALLVKWGADIKTKDSQGNDVQYYLLKNSLLTPSERRMPFAKLLDLYKEKPIAPSFDCEGATRKVEHLICGDPILSMQDQTMAKAYHSWSELLRSPDSKKDQVRWIKEREQACSSLADDAAVTCLQQWTRARVRYLHNRLDEVDPTASTASKNN